MKEHPPDVKNDIAENARDPTHRTENMHQLNRCQRRVLYFFLPVCTTFATESKIGPGDPYLPTFRVLRRVKSQATSQRSCERCMPNSSSNRAAISGRWPTP